MYMGLAEIRYSHDHRDQERDRLIASMDELAPEDRRHVASPVESMRTTSVARLDRSGSANVAIDRTGQRAINSKGGDPDYCVNTAGKQQIYRGLH